MAGSQPERQVWTKPVALRRIRRLDVDGRVVVREEDVVRSEDVVARGTLAAVPFVVSVARGLGLADSTIDPYLAQHPGDQVEEGAVLARRPGFLGLRSRSCLSPTAGVVDSGPVGSGEMLVVPPSRPVEVRAHYPGTVVSVVARRGAVIQMTAVGLQGVVGCGGEGGGRVRLAAEADEPIAAARIVPRFANALIVGGSIDLAGLRRAVTLGVAGVVVGSLRASTFEGYCQEPQQVPLVVTEGFGTGGMSRRCFDLLRQCEGREARLGIGEDGDGSSPPEVIVVIEDRNASRMRPLSLDLGAIVRIAAGRESGAVGQVSAVGAAPIRFASGLVGLWVDVQVGGRSIRVPQTNVEVLAVEPLPS